MSKKRWFRFYIDPWFKGTLGLSPNEIAAYVTVLCELYDHDGIVIRPEFDIMARRCGMRPTSFRKAFDALARRGKLSFDGEVLTSKAVSEEIKSREKLDDKSAESRTNRAEKHNEIKAIREKIPSNKEDRIQNIPSTLKVSALPLPSGVEEKPTKSAAVAGFVKRREMYRRA